VVITPPKAPLNPWQACSRVGLIFPWVWDIVKWCKF